MSEKIMTVNLNPERAGIEHIARLFSQEIDRANKNIANVEKLRNYFEGEDGLRLPAFKFDAQKLITEGLDLLIEQQEQLIESQQKGLDECNRCLALDTSVPEPEPAPPPSKAKRRGKASKVKS